MFALKEKAELVCDCGYVYKSKSQNIMKRVKICNVIADYKYNFLDVVCLNSGVLAIIVGFHPESDKQYYVEVCQRKRVVLGREQWVPTKEYVDNMNPSVSVDYIVDKATQEDTKESLISFANELETASLYLNEVNEIRKKINSL